MVRELARRLRAGETDRAIARNLTIDRKTVAKHRALALRDRLLEGPLLDPEELDRRLKEAASAHSADAPA
jgi:hypothetical protein